MGGSAFASGPNSLSTPRMPRTVYNFVQSRCQTILKEHFTHVATPIEEPGKKDYGDVDFLVACPTQLGLLSSTFYMETIAKALGAQRIIFGKGTSTVNFALPWPEEFPAPSSLLFSDEHQVDLCVQVDVHVCEDEQGWEWELFLHHHGHLWGMIGSIIREYGFGVTMFGLFLKIEEIEAMDRPRSKVLLTRTPSDALSFLGLDESRFWHQFDSAHSLYEYVATCRYFSCVYAERNAEKASDEDIEKRSLPDQMRRKSSTKKTKKQRRLLREWFEGFLPQCRASGAYERETPSKEQIRDDAFRRFGVKDEYDCKLDTWRRERGKSEMWRTAIKASLPAADADVAPALRTAAIKGLRATVIDRDLSYGVTPPSVLNPDGFYNLKSLVEFFTREWQRVGDIELEKQRVRAAERNESRRKFNSRTN